MIGYDTTSHDHRHQVDIVHFEPTNFKATLIAIKYIYPYQWYTPYECQEPLLPDNVGHQTLSFLSLIKRIIILFSASNV